MAVGIWDERGGRKAPVLITRRHPWAWQGRGMAIPARNGIWRLEELNPGVSRSAALQASARRPIKIQGLASPALKFACIHEFPHTDQLKYHENATIISLAYKYRIPCGSPERQLLGLWIYDLAVNRLYAGVAKQCSHSMYWCQRYVALTSLQGLIRELRSRATRLG